MLIQNQACYLYSPQKKRGDAKIFICTCAGKLSKCSVQRPKWRSISLPPHAKIFLVLVLKSCIELYRRFHHSLADLG